MAASLFSGYALADEVVIKGAGVKFDPTVAFVKAGDTVKFTNMAGHDAASIDGMIPEGAQGWKSKLGEELSVTLDKEGAYIYKCTPHAGNGMVAAVLVGEAAPANLEAIKANPEYKGMIKRAVTQLEEALAARGGE
ncbi:MAG: plastocyanin/azurin family copper-binding protein [Gammaproteobacteria bacterium]